MAGILQGVCQSVAADLQGRLEEPDHSSSNWYFSPEYIEKNSPSRRDGIDLKKETFLRKSYCTFVQDLGMRLKLPQVTIATAIVFCHRFFLRQSHAKNDRFMIATVCLFLAGKVEETPVLLQTVISLSYEIRNKKDPNAAQRIKQKEVYEREKELVLLGERLVLTTLGFDLNIHHPYKPLVSAIKKFKVAQNALAQVAWNFINDGLRTSLCLQFKPHHIAAGAIFLAAKFLKVKLPSDGEKLWWQEFDVMPRQLEEVSNQMLELYEQNRGAPTSRSSDVCASSAGPQIDKKAAGEGPPGTPQVKDRRPSLEAMNHDTHKAFAVGIEDVDIDKVKTTMEKHANSMLEGGDKVSMAQLTDEDELLMECGWRDAREENNRKVQPVNEHRRGSQTESSITSHFEHGQIEYGQGTEMDTDRGIKFRGPHFRENHMHSYSEKRRADQVETDELERDYKRPCYQHVK